MDLYHFGIKRRSGRYPFGSGDRPFQSVSNRSRKHIAKAVKKNIKETARAEAAAQKETDKQITKKVSEDYEREETIKRGRLKTKRNVRSLSDTDLKKSIERLRDEKILKDLIDDDVNPKTKMMKDITNEAIKTVGKEVITGGLRYITKQSLRNEEMTLAGLADTIWPRKDDKKKEDDKKRKDS